jgi:hypothetical protein
MFFSKKTSKFMTSYRESRHDELSRKSSVIKLIHVRKMREKYEKIKSYLFERRRDKIKNKEKRVRKRG